MKILDLSDYTIPKPDIGEFYDTQVSCYINGVHVITNKKLNVEGWFVDLTINDFFSEYFPEYIIEEATACFSSYLGDYKSSIVFTDKDLRWFLKETDFSKANKKKNSGLPVWKYGTTDKFSHDIEIVVVKHQRDDLFDKAKENQIIKQKELDLLFNKDLLEYFKIQDNPKAQTLFDKLVAKHGIENKNNIFVAFEESLWLLE